MASLSEMKENLYQLSLKITRTYGTQVERLRNRTQRFKWIPKGGGLVKIIGGSHVRDRYHSREKLNETKNETARCTRHALYVLHSNSRTGRLCQRWCLNWVHRWTAPVHRSS